MHEALSSRVLLRTEVINALTAVSFGSANSAHLHELAERLAIVDGCGDGKLAWAYSRVLEGLSWAIQWEPAIASADQNPSRFRDAARHQAELVIRRYKDTYLPEDLDSAVSALAALDSPDQVRTCAELTMAVPLPSTVSDNYREKRRGTPRPIAEPVDESRFRLPVLILLAIDDQPIQSPVAIHPHRIYNLRVATRVLNWPKGAHSLFVDFVGTLSQRLIELEPTEISRESTYGDTNLMLRGELALGRKVDFLVRAAFKMDDGSLEPVRVVGHPRLTLATFDPATALPVNLPTAQVRLQDMLATLDAKLPTIPAQDRKDLFTLLESLLRYANRAMQDRLLTSEPVRSEGHFQHDLKVHLNADPNIGARLWEAPRQGGGITDLGLGEVVLELKVEQHRSVAMADSVKYLSQATQYASGMDRQVSILCIFDDSEKSSPPGVIANYVDWMFPRLHGLEDPAFPSMVAVLIVPVRFPSPSTWSR